MSAKRIGIAAVSVTFVAILAWVMVDFLRVDGQRELSGFNVVGEEIEETGPRRAKSRSGMATKVSTDAPLLSDEAEPDTEASASAMGIRVRVLNENEMPVAGARVELHEASRDNREMRGMMSRFMGGASTSKPMAFALTDASGLAFVEGANSGRLRIVARAEMAFGALTVGGNREEEDQLVDAEADHVVVLKSVRILVATVQNAAREPAGNLLLTLSPVRGDESGRNSRRRGRPSFERLSAWTDEVTGKARFEITHESSGFDTATKVQVSPQLFGVESNGVTVDLAPRGLTETDLTVPDTVTVLLSIRDLKGGTIAESTQVNWTVQPKEDPADEGANQWRRNFGRNLFGLRTVEDGKARIAGFVTGATVTFSASPEDRMNGEVETLLPASPKEHAVEMEIGDKRPIVVLHVNEIDGLPAARTLLSVELKDDNAAPQEDQGEGFNFNRIMSRMRRGMSNTRRLRTDKNGKLVLRALPETTGSIRLQFADSFRGFGGDDQKPLAEVLFANLKPGEKRDLGEVTLDRGPLLLAGRVIDSNGKPISGLRLSVTVTDEDAQGDQEGRGRGGFGRGGFGGRGRGNTTRLTVRTKKDGSFTAHRDVNLLAIGRLQLEDRRWTADVLSFNPGDENLVMTALRGGSLSGRVTKSDAALMGRIRVAANIADEEPAGGNSRGRRGRTRNTARINPDGTFTIRNLKPGTYSLNVTLSEMSAFTQDGLRIYENQDTAVQPIVVGDGFQVVDVLVTDAEGLPLKDARVSASPQREGRGGSRWGRGSERTDENGHASVLIPSGSAITMSVSSGRQRVTQVVQSSGFPVTLSMKDAAPPRERGGRPRSPGNEGGNASGGRRQGRGRGQGLDR